MKHFLIQTVGDRVKHDFSFALLEAIEYQNWYFQETLYEASFADIESMSFFDLRNLVPVGSLEFVGEYLRSFYQNMPSPLNIPEQLQTFEFLRRNVGFCNEKTIPFPSFVKSATKYKAFTNIVEKTSKPAPPDKYFWSEIVDFQSEWRAFVWNNRFVGLQYYLGDFTLFPDVIQIKK